MLVNDISYQSKGSGNWIFKAYANAYIGNVDYLQKAMQGVGGFEVPIKSYICNSVAELRSKKIVRTRMGYIICRGYRRKQAGEMGNKRFYKYWVYA